MLVPRTSTARAIGGIGASVLDSATSSAVARGEKELMKVRRNKEGRVGMKRMLLLALVGRALERGIWIVYEDDDICTEYLYWRLGSRLNPGQGCMGCASYGVAGYQVVLGSKRSMCSRMQNAICTTHSTFFPCRAYIVVMQILGHFVPIVS